MAKKHISVEVKLEAVLQILALINEQKEKRILKKD